MGKIFGLLGAVGILLRLGPIFWVFELANGKFKLAIGSDQRKDGTPYICSCANEHDAWGDGLGYFRFDQGKMDENGGVGVGVGRVCFAFFSPSAS